MIRNTLPNKSSCFLSRFPFYFWLKVVIKYLLCSTSKWTASLESRWVPSLSRFWSNFTFNLLLFKTKGNIPPHLLLKMYTKYGSSYSNIVFSISTSFKTMPVWSSFCLFVFLDNTNICFVDIVFCSCNSNRKWWLLELLTANREQLEQTYFKF